MNRTERFYRIDQLFQSWTAVSMAELQEQLGVSRATVVRDIEYLRDRMNAPIVWDREKRGYHYDAPVDESTPWSLPGLWFSESEAHALLTMEHLLSKLSPGLLGPHIAPLRSRIRTLLESGDYSLDEIENRIRILPMASRSLKLEHFQTIASALLGRHRLAIVHYNRHSGESIPREVSPQRLAHYRDNWYLDAWCHTRDALRSFSVDAITNAVTLEKRALNIAPKKLDKELSSGYGIFAGQNITHAKLKFSPWIARWVSRETWHPQQQGEFDEQGYYLLTLPYTNDAELLMDIFRYGPEVEVLGPANLRQRYRERMLETLEKYNPDN